MNSVHTIKNYISYLEEAYLIFQLFSFSFKLKNQLRGAKKIYTIDAGLIKSITFQFSQNLGKLMENIVFLQLKRKGNEFYFYNEPADGEVDFIIREGLKIKELIQVCHNLDDLETREREIRSLIRGSKQLECSNLIIITYDQEKEEIIKEKKIKFIPLWKWLSLKDKDTES
ncbi:MAG: DUF4143 domain-containing protein [Candidatus Hydromicrobium sp.]